MYVTYDCRQSMQPAEQPHGRTHQAALIRTIVPYGTKEIGGENTRFAWAGKCLPFWCNEFLQRRGSTSYQARSTYRASIEDPAKKLLDHVPRLYAPLKKLILAPER